MSDEWVNRATDDLRARQVVRTWRLLVLLRERPRTLEELSERLEVHERTVRRDLKALERVPFPLCWDDGLWSLPSTPEWPRREQTPLAQLRG